MDIKITRKVFQLFMSAVFLSGVVSYVQAAEINCDPLPDCTELGYELDIECETGTDVRCPFDARYKKCINATCVDMGFTLSGKQSWCLKIVNCPSNPLYTLCAEACSACPSNSSTTLNCKHGHQIVGQNNCGYDCYQCNKCPHDDEQGWDESQERCDPPFYTKETLYGLCDDTEGQTRYVCERCPEGTTTSAPNSDTCVCDEANGYVTAENRLEGVEYEEVETSFGVCYKQKGCAPSHTTDTSDNHFTYGTAQGGCYPVVGCNSTKDGSRTTPYTDLEFATTSKTLGGVTCHWITGCASGYVQECDVVHDMYSQKTLGGYTCGLCRCDEDKGYYAQCPTGYSCVEDRGCYMTSGCGDGYVSDNSDEHFTYGTSQDGCYPVVGCNSNKDGSRTTPYTDSKFTTQSKTLGGVTCHWITGCATGYSTSKPTGTAFSYTEYTLGGKKCYDVSCSEQYQEASCTGYNVEKDKQTFGSLTCRKCEEDDSPRTCCPDGWDHYQAGSEGCTGASYDRSTYSCMECDNDYYLTIEVCLQPNCDETKGYYAQCPDPFTCSNPGVCREITGCVSGYATSQPSNTTAFSYTKYTANKVPSGTQECYDVSCKSPYQEAECGDGYIEKDKQTFGSLTCRTCEGCEKISECREIRFYPYSKSNLPTGSVPAGSTCYIYNEKCERKEERYTNITCSEGYHEATNSSTGLKYCVPNDCAYYNKKTLAQCNSAKEHDCQKCSSSSHKSGTSTITCYALSNEDCRTRCEDFEGYYASTSDAPDGYSCGSVTEVTTDLGTTIDCYKCEGPDCSCASDESATQTDYYNKVRTFTCGGTTHTCYYHEDCSCRSSESSTQTDYYNKARTFTCGGQTHTCYYHQTTPPVTPISWDNPLECMGREAEDQHMEECCECFDACWREWSGGGNPGLNGCDTNTADSDVCYYMTKCVSDCNTHKDCCWTNNGSTKSSRVEIVIPSACGSGSGGSTTTCGCPGYMEEVSEAWCASDQSEAQWITCSNGYTKCCM